MDFAKHEVRLFRLSVEGNGTRGQALEKGRGIGCRCRDHPGDGFRELPAVKVDRIHFQRTRPDDAKTRLFAAICQKLLKPPNRLRITTAVQQIHDRAALELGHRLRQQRGGRTLRQEVKVFHVRRCRFASQIDDFRAAVGPHLFIQAGTAR